MQIERRQLTILIPALPPKEASPNFNPRGEGISWVKIKALKGWRDLVYFSAISARNKWARAHRNHEWETLPRAIITITFQAPNKSYVQDDANALGSLKGAIDELTSSRLYSSRRGKRGTDIILDDSPDVLTWAKPHWEFGKEKATIIRIEEV